tara:strand:- start:178 stop:423 length:246 start_codon:yes stop_codon:yes gene_type:complete
MIRLQSKAWRKDIHAEIGTGDTDILGLEPDAPCRQSVLDMRFSATQTIQRQEPRTNAYSDAPRVFGVRSLESPRRAVRAAI